MKKLPLTHVHESLGAKMIEFAGFYMPIQYEGVVIEHHAVRNGVGVFDVSHMGQFLISSSRALGLIQMLTSNDASKLSIGMAQYSYMPNDTGGIVDDLIVYRTEQEQYLLVVNGANIQKDWDWILSHNTMGAVLENVSEVYTLLAIQGPKSIEALQSLTEVQLDNIPFYTFKKGDFAGAPNVIISATGYTGSGGFEIYVENKYAEQVWKAIFTTGSDYDIRPIGLAARDTLRLEMGFCLYGNDIDDKTSPIEARLGWVTKFSKNFINAEAIKKQQEEGVAKKLLGFELQEKGIPREGYTILSEQGETIGRVTSGTMSPSLKKGIGMGYISSRFSKIGNSILIKIRDRNVHAIIVKMPFYKLPS